MTTDQRYSTRYTVIGAGHGGKAMAAHLGLMGYEVRLFNRTPGRIAAVREMRGIEVESPYPDVQGFASIETATSDMGEALDSAEVVMVVVPATAHAPVARVAAPHLRDGQIVVLNPGRTCGAIEFTKVLRDSGCEADVTVAEASTLIYASRTMGPAEVKVFSIKQAVPLAALPATRTAGVLSVIRKPYPQFVDGGDVLRTGLDNMGSIFHPALTILNAGRIEDTHGEFQFYIDGATPTVASFLEVVDRERVTVAAALGVKAKPALEWLKDSYGVESESLYEAIQQNEGYSGIGAPTTLHHRYIYEDVPMSLVPIASLGARYGVRTTAIRSLVDMASMLHRTDYWSRGRTIDKLGINNLSVTELMAAVTEGHPPAISMN